MKKEYKALELELVNFDAEDVITASGGCDPDKVPCNIVLVPCDPMSCMCLNANQCMEVICRPMECIVG